LVVNQPRIFAIRLFMQRTVLLCRARCSGTGVTLVLPEQQTDVGKLAGRLGHAASFEASVGRPPAPRRRRRRG
jgi:hypothetical protein